MDFDAQPSLSRLFFAQAERLGPAPFLFRKEAGGWVSLNWANVAGEVRRLAGFLIELGVVPGDRIALVAENRPEWLIADLAILSAGGITVPAFTTNTIDDHLHILTNSGAKGVIVSSGNVAQRLLPAALKAPDLAFVLFMDEEQRPTQMPFRQYSWREAVPPEAVTQAVLSARIAAQRRRDASCIIYTSGTGGVPKGVVLTHGSILCNLKGAHRLLLEVGLGDDRFLSFLPLSHSYEHTAGLFLPIGIGAEIWFAESVDKLTDNMAEARPTIMTAVPRLYEVMHARIQRGIEKAPPLRRRLFHLAYRLGRKRYEHPGSLSLGERLLDLLCELLVRRKVRQRFGGRLKAFVSGGAALNYEIGVFFLALGVRLLQGYGQTEASPVISANPPSRIKIDTVGPVFDGLEARIAADGEILVRGEAVMQGYWRDPEATARTVVDGWLHTGDIGVFDEDDYLTITDRKKDIIVLSGGDNVSPARIEGFLALRPEIAQAMVYGDKRAHLVALIVPDSDFAQSWAERHGKAPDPAQLVQDSDFHKDMAAIVDTVNASLSAIERVRRFALLPEAFTIDNGMLTPSMKIRRHKIRSRWGETLERLY